MYLFRKQKHSSAIGQMSVAQKLLSLWFSNRSDTNRAVQAQKIARGWKFWI